MPMPLRALPVAQNWDCRGCTACCRSYHVPVSVEEQKRIEGQGWETDPELKGVPLFERSGNWWSGYEFRLASRPNGDCVFLTSDGRCRIHLKHGSTAKPLACRVYPYVLVPTGDEWRLGLRFGCPTAGANTGTPLADHLSDARPCAAELETASPAVRNAPPVPLVRGRSLPWPDLFRIVAAVSGAFAEPGRSVEWTWRRVLGFVAMLRGMNLGDPARAVTGARLTKLVDGILTAMAEETTLNPAELPRPGWVGRMLFRSVLAAYVRKDTGADRGPALRWMLGRLLAAWRFTRGRGAIPRVHNLIPDHATFTQAEQPTGPLPPQAAELLSRYYRVKLESLQFCGSANFGLPFWDGLESLAITFPAVMWLARVLLASGIPHANAIDRALRVIDDNFGYNRLLGMGRQKSALRLLSGRDELPRLVAWYGR